MKLCRQLEMLITANHHPSVTTPMMGDNLMFQEPIDIYLRHWPASSPLLIQSARLTQDDWMLCICGGPLSCNPPRWLLIMVDYTLKSFLLLLTIIM